MELIGISILDLAKKGVNMIFGIAVYCLIALAVFVFLQLPDELCFPEDSGWKMIALSALASVLWPLLLVWLIYVEFVSLIDRRF